MAEIAAPGWRDFASAPKDGTTFHVWAPGYEWPETVRWAAYSPEDAEEIGEPGYWTYAEQLLADATDDCGSEHWTHWRGLPPPPAESSDAGRPLGGEGNLATDEQFLPALQRLARAIHGLRAVRPIDWNDGEDPELEAAWQEAEDALGAVGVIPGRHSNAPCRAAAKWLYLALALAGFSSAAGCVVWEARQASAQINVPGIEQK